MTRTHDLMAALAAAKPKAFEPEDRTDEALRARDLASILTNPSETRQRTIARSAAVPRRRPAVIAGLGGAAAAAVVAGLVVLALVPADQGAAPATGSSALADKHRGGAREFLLAAAHSAQRLPTTATGAYRYEEIRTSEIHTFGTGGKMGQGPAYTVELSQVTRSWTGASRSRSVTTQAQPRFLTGRDRANWRTAGAPALQLGSPPGERAPSGPFINDLDLPATYLLGDESLTEQQLRRLPADPERLAARLRAAIQPQLDRQNRPPTGAKPSSDPAYPPPSAEALLFDAAAQLLSSPVTTAVRTAAFTIMADLGGARPLGTVTDPIGREGTGVSFPESPAADRVYIFDEATTQLLATQYIVRDPAAARVRVPSGTAILTQVWVKSGRTDKFGQEP